jgi:HEAT repeat protein
MPKRLEQQFGLSPDKLGRLAHFVCLSSTLGAATVLGISLAESVFLANAHQDRLPLFYVLLAVVSIPVASVFSGLVDRYRRPLVFRYLLISCIALVILLRLLLDSRALAVYFAVYIGLSVIELLLDILFWVLLGDYFTSLELKRYATLLVAAMALGGLLGGGAAFLLSDLRHVPTGRLLLILPILYGVAIFQLAYLDRTQKEIGARDPDEEAEGGLLASLKAFPPLLRRYPIVVLLVGNMFLVAAIQRVTDYQVFSIYEDTFKTEDALTGFLGLLNAFLNVLEVLFTFFLTRPLIQRLGVGGMNLVYPVTTIASFAGLALPQVTPASARFQLASGVAGHVNYDTLYNSLAQPVETLNYNAVPRRFLGRVRVLNDGLIYPAGTALAGVSLLLVEKLEVPALSISLAGMGLGVLLLGVGYLTSRSYLKSLVEMLRSRAVNLDEVSEGLARLPSRYADEIRQLLASDDPTAQRLGVQLAARMDPTLFLGELEALLARGDATLYRSIVKLYAAVRQQETAQRVRGMLRSENEAMRQVALEALIAGGARLDSNELHKLLADANPVIRALACVAARQAGNSDAAVETEAAEIFPAKLDAAAREAVVRAIRSTVEGGRGRSGSDGRALVPLLKEVLPGADAAVKREALETLVEFAGPGDADLEELASAELVQPDAAMRAAACQILGQVHSDAGLARLAAGLEDANTMVREKAATAVASYGERALPRVEELLNSSRPEVVDAAIAVLGRIRTRRTEERLFEFMKADYRQVAQNLRWLERIPSDQPAWRALRDGIEDSNQRVIRRVLHVLSSLGHERTLNCVRRIMHTTDERVRADAVETLASLSHRRFVEPILPLLEQQASRDAARRPRETPEAGDGRLLQEVVHSSDRWIRIGALAVLCADRGPMLDDSLMNDPDPLVREALLHTLLAKSHAATAGTSAGSREGVAGGEASTGQGIPRGEVFFMNRVMFLRGIPLFQYLALDDLLIIDTALTQKEFLAGETIFTEGSLGAEFCIVYRGTVLIRKIIGAAEQELARLGSGECFGEMALFDDSPRSATAIALTDCTLLALERSRFNSLLVQRTEMALEICRVLSLRLRAANERLGSQAQAAH